MDHQPSSYGPADSGPATGFDDWSSGAPVGSAMPHVTLVTPPFVPVAVPEATPDEHSGAQPNRSSTIPVMAAIAEGQYSDRPQVPAPQTESDSRAPVPRSNAQLPNSVSATFNTPSMIISGWRGSDRADGGSYERAAPRSRGGPMIASTVQQHPSRRLDLHSSHHSPRPFDPTEVPTLKYTLNVTVTRDGKVVEEPLDPYEVARLYGQQQAALRQLQSRYDFLAVPDWVRLHPRLGTYLAELVGTFAWVLTLSLVSVRNQSIFSVSDDTNMTPLPIGFMFTSMIFTFGYISGAHFNPAISIAVFLIHSMELVQCFAYILCQLAAALAAGVVAMLIQGNTNIFAPSVSNSYISSGIFSELIYTLAICLVVLNIAYSRQSGNFFYGFAVGMTMSAGSASVGHISGGAFNPAAATGLQVAMCLAGKCDNLKSMWIYWLAPVAGAVIAAILFAQMAQPADTQILEDVKVFQDVNQLHKQRQMLNERLAVNEATTATQDREGDHDGASSSSSSSSQTSTSSSHASDHDAPKEMMAKNRLRDPRPREERDAEDVEIMVNSNGYGKRREAEVSVANGEPSSNWF